MELLKRGKDYIVKYKWYLLGAILMLLIVTLADLVVPRLTQRIIDDGILKNKISVIWQVAIYLIVITIVKAFASFFQAYWSQSASQHIAYSLRNDLFKKLEYLEFSFHDSNNIGQLLTRTTNDVEGIRNFFATGLLQIIGAVITLVGSAIILCTTEWKLFLYVAAVLPFILLIFVFMFSRLSPIFTAIQQNLGQLNTILQENIIGIRVVKAFTAEPLEFQKYSLQNNTLYNENIRMIRTFSNGFPFIFFLSNIATIIVLYFGGSKVINGSMSIGTLVAFNSYLTFLVQPIFQLGIVLQQFAQANASGKRVFNILDTQSTIHSPENPVPFPSENPGDIEFKNVSFSYIQDEDTRILQNINLKIKRGTNIAIVGITGSGKSTLVSLIPRFYDPLQGEVLINDVNVKDYDLTELRQNIGIVLQQIRLINGTVRENIYYGKPNASDAEIERVVKLAHVDSFLSKIPEGLNFEVGEGGQNLSGGQRQRIAIARMLLVKPKIVILDDATSALDANTERDIKKDAQPYIESNLYTVVIITQKLNTVTMADEIVVMDKGKIVAQGSHAHLLQTSEVYRALLNQDEYEPA